MNISSTPPVNSQSDINSSLSSAEVAERQKVVSAIRALSQGNMFGENRELTFSLDRSTRRMIIQVIDRDTGDTVMTLPPEYVLRLSQSMKHGT